MLYAIADEHGHPSLHAIKFWFLALLILSSLARADEDAERARRLWEGGKILPLEKILEYARAHQTGEVLETELGRSDEGYVYELEILDEFGQVWELELDAKSGRLLKRERED